MTKNIGLIDRVVRIVVALSFIALIITGVVSGVLAVILGVFAAVFVITSATSFCPLYLPFKLSTHK